MLLDFLMDFVPETEIFFLGDEAANSKENCKEIDGDAEFEAQLLQNCLESYHLWDKKLEDEFEKKKMEIADLYVQKRCGIDGIDVLNYEIEQLSQLYEDVRKQRPYIDPKDEETCENLKSMLKKTSQKLEKISEEYQNDNKQLEQMMKSKESLYLDTKRLEKVNCDLQKAIEQIINEEWAKQQNQKKDYAEVVQQKAQFVQKHEELRIKLRSYERSLEDLKQREQKQIEEFSNMWQALTGEIEKFNLFLRDLIAATDYKNYHQIPLNATEQDIEKLHEVLNTLRDQMEQKLQAAKKQNTELEMEIDEINHAIASDLELQIAAKAKLIEEAQKSLQDLKSKITKESKDMFIQQQKLNDDLRELNCNVEKLVEAIASNRKELDQLTKENEDRLTKAEEAQGAYIADREAHIGAYETGIKECMQELEIVKEHFESEMEKREKKTEKKQ